MRFIEKVGEDCGLFWASMQPFASRRLNRVAVARRYLSQGTLDVAVEQPTGIQVRHVPCKKEQLDTLGVLVEPALDNFGPVRRVPVDDQKDFAPGLLNEPLAEDDEPIGSKAFFEDHEAHLAFVGQRRDRVAAQALVRHVHQRGLPHRGKVAYANIVGAKPGVIPPVQQSLLALGAPVNGWVDVGEPLRDRLLVSFVGARDQTRHGSSRSASDGRPRAQLQAHHVFAHDQQLHRRPGPEVRGQLQLLRHLAHDQPPNALGLSRAERTCLAGHAV